MPMASTRSLTPVLYPVMESFYTLQGEGFHQGKAAYFIRLGGCDVGCVWCDVKDSWDASRHPLKTPASLLEPLEQVPAKLVVITGGEPLLHPLDPLTDAFREKGYQLHLETSGSHALSGNWDWICLSPKKFKPPLPAVVPAAHELKVVVYHKADFEWAESYAAQVNPDCKLYLQPEWEKKEVMIPLIVEYIMANPQWELSLQLHKYIHLP